MYDPGVFTHSPCAQGFLSHSSSSAEAKKRMKPLPASRFHFQESLLTDTLSPDIQPEAHVALAAVVAARQGDASAVHAEVADGQAHVGGYVPSLDGWIWGHRVVDTNNQSKTFRGFRIVMVEKLPVKRPHTVFTDQEPGRSGGTTLRNAKEKRKNISQCLTSSNCRWIK